MKTKTVLALSRQDLEDLHTACHVCLCRWFAAPGDGTDSQERRMVKLNRRLQDTLSQLKNQTQKPNAKPEHKP